jgi:DMSO/TMAO reductase YedYZ molybdopterin-dependent catalytic subunit
MNRREFIAASLLAPALARLQPPSGGRLVGTVPFRSPTTRVAPLQRLLGSGLDARLFSDLSSLAPDALVTPTEHFFIRSAAAPALPAASGWTVALGGLTQDPAVLDIPALERLSRPAGRYLMECSGNADPANYGLISVADWEGAPLSSILERMRPADTPSAAYRVLVSGFDDEKTPARTSVPGASWIFSRDDLSQAVLALRMNGAPLTRDHGAPVRLVVPGWYGCACIKWVNRIDLVADDAPPTTQMSEFATRTHQIGPPALAREYTPATIDTAAAPVRIERWEIGGGIDTLGTLSLRGVDTPVAPTPRTVYRVVGIVWGGTPSKGPTNALAIRFKATEPWVPVESCPMPASTLTWSLWTHTWRPQSPGRYEIALKVTDPSIRTRRLDLFYYVREVTIDEV